MPVFSQRHRGYQAGVVLLLLSVVMATWGVIAPGWLREEVEGGAVMYHDLWFINCQNGFSGCDSELFGTEDASFLATLALSCLGLLLLLCSCVALIRGNFCLSVPSYGCAAEVLALLGGLSLFIGSMAYVGDNTQFLQDFPAMGYGPSFILTLSSSVLTGLGGVLLSVYNKRPGTSYYCRFRAVPVTNSYTTTPTMVEATSTAPYYPPSSSSSSVQRSKHSKYQSMNGNGYGYMYPQHSAAGVVAASAGRPQASMNSVYHYEDEQVLYDSYQNSPLFR
ncbi:uncharacterized protein LOC143297830 [Babylonia areolata]|uniref:uncharacterized protein LOC143297830 n=1 Tax=Babylonia areolata TaxID=304850 RepID=UPI003FD44B3A